jgi:hypothetical protein
LLFIFTGYKNGVYFVESFPESYKMKISSEAIQEALTILDILPNDWASANEEEKRALIYAAKKNSDQSDKILEAYFLLSEAAYPSNRIIDYIQENIYPVGLRLDTDSGARVMEKFYEATEEEKLRFFKWHPQICNLLTWIAMNDYAQASDDLESLISLFATYAEEGHAILKKMPGHCYGDVQIRENLDTMGVIYAIIEYLPEASEPTRILKKIDALLDLIGKHPDVAQQFASEYSYTQSIHLAIEVEGAQGVAITKSLLNLINKCATPETIVRELPLPNPVNCKHTVNGQVNLESFKAIWDFFSQFTQKDACLSKEELLCGVAFSKGYTDENIPSEERAIHLQRLAHALSALNTIAQDKLPREEVLDASIFKRKNHRILAEGIECHTVCLIASELASYIANPSELINLFYGCSPEQTELLKKITSTELALREMRIDYPTYLELRNKKYPPQEASSLVQYSLLHLQEDATLIEKAIFDVSTIILSERALNRYQQELYSQYAALVSQGLSQSMAARIIYHDQIKNEDMPATSLSFLSTASTPEMKL